VNSAYSTQINRLTLFSSADHQEDKLFFLCLTRDSDKVYVNTNKSKEDAIWFEALVATKCKEWRMEQFFSHCCPVTPHFFTFLAKVYQYLSAWQV